MAPTRPCCWAWKASIRTRSIRTAFPTRWSASAAAGGSDLLGKHEIAFEEKRDLIFNKRQKLPFHTNGMRFSRLRRKAATSWPSRDYYSVGGGFVVNHDEAAEDRIVADTTEQPYPFSSGDEMLALCEKARHDHRPADAGQRIGLASRGGNARRPADHLAGHAGLRQPRPALARRAARRAESDPPRAGDGRRSCATSPKRRCRIR